MRPDKFKNNILPLADKLFRLALSITGNKQDAEDVVQDTMLNVWRKKEEWDKIGNMEGYCLRSIRNIAIDKISMKENQLEQMPERFDFPEEADDAQDVLERREQLSMIGELVGRLPEKQRTVFQLRDVENMSYKEIAGIMNISEEQVKVNLFRARQKIKEYFNRNNK